MRKLIWIVLFFTLSRSFGQIAGEMEQHCVDSIYTHLTLEQRIGQLMMIRAHSGKGEEYEQSVAESIRKYAVGGLCFFQGTPERQVKLVNQYQKISKVPLLISTGCGIRIGDASPKYIQISLSDDDGGNG